MYDVLIAGAGPAGNTAALELARNGFSVAVLDYRELIGDKLCTGVIGVECAARFPVSDELVHRQARTARIVSPSGKTYRVERSDPQALIIDRVAYINSIAESAMQSGAEYHLGCRARDLTRTPYGIHIEANRQGEEAVFEGRVLMIATGFGSALTRMAGLRDGKGQDHLLGSQMQVQTSGVSETEVYLGNDVAPSSFGWLVPTSDSKALLGIISRQRVNGHLDELKTGLKESGKVVVEDSETKQWGIPLKPLPRTYGDRVMILGDAAGFAKPTTGGGIYYAMLSGVIAAEVTARAFDSGDVSAGGLSPYEDRWKDEFGNELKIGFYARMLFESMSDAQLDRLMEIFLSEEVQSELIDSPDFSFDRHSRTILRTVAHGQMGGLIGTFGPTVAPLLARLVKSTIFA